MGITWAELQNTPVWVVLGYMWAEAAEGRFLRRQKEQDDIAKMWNDRDARNRTRGLR